MKRHYLRDWKLYCDMHPNVELLKFCPACRGTKGGKAVSPEARANRLNKGGRPLGAKDKHPRKRRTP